ncbi:geminin coiled-coil domain-containing protein 1 [Phalacrocorax carbo]|uniref:geminin coiled-coil domain-containing protein 1 n=1 Tax=Phalacrocorax carbo TaxID=9209 RepID=UPI003119FF05
MPHRLPSGHAGGWERGAHRPPSAPPPRPLASAEHRPAVPGAGLRRGPGLRLPLVRPRRGFQGDLGRRLRRGAAAEPGPAGGSAAGIHRANTQIIKSKQLYHRAIDIKLQSQHLFINISIPQLQDTLLQKEEELARLHEENNNLRQYLNSALIKCLEEKAKKLLSCHGQKNCAIFKSTKRRLKEDQCFVPQETPHASKARRNLFNEFTACEEQASPAVDSWVLQTLGLKDVNTIDETSANYSALSSDLGKDTYCLSPGEAIDYDHSEGAAAVYSCSHTPPADSSTHPCSEDSPFLPHFSSAPCVSSSVPNISSLPAYGLPYLTGNLSPNKTEVAFTTSLSPHRNVRTHTFHQGQAFVRRDDDGGWRFTWVPKQAE